MKADNGGVEIRRITSGDEGLFDNVADDVFDHPIDPKVLAAYLAEPNHYFIAAVHEGVVIGQCAAVIHRHPDLRPTELYIDEVAVAPPYQQRGIARRMLDAMLALGKSLGCEQGWIGTEHDNAAARGLYASVSEKTEDFVMYEFKL